MPSIEGQDRLRTQHSGLSTWIRSLVRVLDRSLGNDDLIDVTVDALGLVNLALSSPGGLFSLPFPLELFPLSLHD